MAEPVTTPDLVIVVHDPEEPADDRTEADRLTELYEELGGSD